MDTLKTTQPDIVMLDLTPDITNEIILELQRLVSGSKMVLWLRSVSPELTRHAARLGVAGILLKNLSPQMLVKCLNKVADGERLFDGSRDGDGEGAEPVKLSQREKQLIALLAQGMRNKEIANALFLSEGTVKVYLSRLFQKTGMKDRFELALYGVKQRGLDSRAVSTGFSPVPRHPRPAGFDTSKPPSSL